VFLELNDMLTTHFYARTPFSSLITDDDVLNITSHNRAKGDFG